MTRDEAITLLEKLRTFHNGTYAKSIDMAIEALSAEDKTKCVARIEVDTEEIVKRIKEEYDIIDGWIPVSERLPENGHYYLWCSDMGQVQSDYYWNGFENGMKYGYNIVAWLPLPKPYKGGDSE